MRFCRRWCATAGGDLAEERAFRAAGSGWAWRKTSRSRHRLLPGSVRCRCCFGTLPVLALWHPKCRWAVLGVHVAIACEHGDRVCGGLQVVDARHHVEDGLGREARWWRSRRARPAWPATARVARSAWRPRRGSALPIPGRTSGRRLPSVIMRWVAHSRCSARHHIDRKALEIPTSSDQAPNAGAL